MDAVSANHAADLVPVRRGWRREVGVIIALLAVLAAPWWLKPSQSSAFSNYDRRLVILTPHHGKIRQEFARAFARYWREKTGQVVYVDWRTGGTAELAMLLRSEYGGAFQQHWTRTLEKEWSHEVGLAYASSKVKPTDESVAGMARRAFLESNVGIGVDLFFGGGSFDFEQQASAGILVAADPSGKFGLKPLMKKHPEWFTDEVIPLRVSGEPFYDAELRWVGTCLSNLGICYNSDVLKRLGIEQEPSQWADLADPRLVGQVALSDPNKSGTVTKSLEQLIQQQMQLRLEELAGDPGLLSTEESRLGAALEQGWERGLRLIQKVSANARYFTDSATKIPLEVSQGDAAAGMCIDFYGRSLEEQVRRPDGSTRIHFVAPAGGSSVGVDPVGMLRGAPDPELAMAFMEFVLSPQGQKLWNFRPGTEGGPVEASLRRLPVRRDFYTAENLASMSDAGLLPFEQAEQFTYRPEWTGSLFNAVRFLVKVMCIHVHQDQQRAWKAIIEAGFPPRALAVFEDVSLANYGAAKNLAADLAKKDKELEMRLTREMTQKFRRQYELAYQLAKESRK
jgi:iron(III) transport system substrate-binding protein